ncbi:hypothetical protein ZEAMMB73_Zm00001d018591 [Zea mays]|uniref:Uncharacterized protein n=1 Tax=Zea mays TaxID=4577 RepID=A0A1D6HQH0_MAIZE|nr:hypothetical protein ZEAMMB73_Zm00001d018591 [Zea mays]
MIIPLLFGQIVGDGKLDVGKRIFMALGKNYLSLKMRSIYLPNKPFLELVLIMKWNTRILSRVA